MVLYFKATACVVEIPYGTHFSCITSIDSNKLPRKQNKNQKHPKIYKEQNNYTKELWVFVFFFFFFLRLVPTVLYYICLRKVHIAI